MGDIADWVADMAFDPVYDEHGEELIAEDGFWFPKAAPSCRYCKKKNLVWINLGTEAKPIWRLSHDGKTPHTCKEYFLKRR